MVILCKYDVIYKNRKYTAYRNAARGAAATCDMHRFGVRGRQTDRQRDMLIAKLRAICK